MDHVERRTYRRLPLKLGVVCHRICSESEHRYLGNTIDVSPGGMLTEMDAAGLSWGQLVSVEIAVPPTEGLLDSGGRFSSHCRVVRVEHDGQDTAGKGAMKVKRVAFEFCQFPRLRL